MRPSATSHFEAEQLLIRDHVALVIFHNYAALVVILSDVDGCRLEYAKDVDHDHVAPEIIVARDERPPFAADLRDRKIRGCCADRKAEVKASADLEQDHHQKLIRKTTYRRYTVSLLIYEGNKSSAQDTPNFQSFLKNLRGQGGPNLILTVAATDAPFVGPNGAPIKDASGFAQALSYIGVSHF